MSCPQVALLVCDRFSPFHLSVPGLVFGNSLPGESLFELRLCAADPGPLTSSLGLQLVAGADLSGLATADLVVVPYWRAPEERPPEALLQALQQAHARGARLVGLCLGTYVLAYAGLLDGRPAATHWEFADDFAARFPAVGLDAEALYRDDGDLVTSAGTAASLDCCLYLVRQYHGPILANRLARRLVVAPHREGGQAQFIQRPLPQAGSDARINGLLARLEQQLAAPGSLDALAASVAMSRRTFTRKFLQATGLSVGEWLTQRRLQQAQGLLLAGHSVARIAEQLGFGSEAALRTQFKRQYHLTPSQWRRNFQGQ